MATTNCTFSHLRIQRVTDIHTPVNNENGICSWYAYILNDINDINNGYIGGACPYKNNGFGGGDGHAPHICRCENQLVVAKVKSAVPHLYIQLSL